VFAIIQPYLEPDDIVIDVGAHGGLWTAALSRAVPQGRVYAFEALPYYAGVLLITARINRWRNVDVINKAVLDSPRTVEMVWRDQFGNRLTGTTHVIGGLEDADDTVTVEGITLDLFGDRLPPGRVRFIKCDVEGCELLVLRGSVRLIERHRPMFWCAVSTSDTARYDYTPADMFQFLTDRNYKAFIFDKDGQQIQMTDASLYPGHGDILAVPAELANTLLALREQDARSRRRRRSGLIQAVASWVMKEAGSVRSRRHGQASSGSSQ
jgi:FkbM family methyltransferase